MADQKTEISTPLACKPDPYKEVCAKIPTEFSDHYRSADKVSNLFEDRWYDDFRNLNRIFYDKLKKEKSGSDLSHAIYQKILSRIKRGYVDEKKLGRFQSTVKDVAALFRKMLAAAPGIPQDEKQALIKRISPCERNVYFNLIFTTDPGKNNNDIPNQLNASMSLDFDAKNIDSERMKIGNKYQVGDVTTPIGDFSSVCTISATAMTIEYCQSMNPECLFLIAHELGHRIDSCSYAYDFYNYKAEGLELVNRLNDGFDDDRLRVTKIHQQSARYLTNFMIEQTACLNSFSSPQDAIPSSCEAKKNFAPSLDDQRRCSFNGTKGYPSQWREAEADFWASSAMATYLKNAKHSLEENRRDVLRPIWFWCVSHQVDQEKITSGIPMRDWTIKTDYSNSTDSSDSTTSEPEAKATAVPPAQACETVPRDVKDRGKTAWSDEHQSWSTRINRNYLRNSDLRKALGCPATSEVPVTCSPPEGTTSSFLIE